MMAGVTGTFAAAAEPEAAEAEAMVRARNGDVRAFDQLIRPRVARSLRLAMSILRDESDARDVVQDACLLAWRELPRLREVAKFDAWLARIVVNACRDFQRRRRRVSVREIPTDDFIAESTPASTRSTSETLASVDTIRRAFSRLDVDDRTILVLHHVEEQPVARIARALGIPVGTAKWRLHRARRALEKAMELESR